MTDELICYIDKPYAGADLTAINFYRRTPAGVQYAIRGGGAPHDRGRLGWRAVDEGLDRQESLIVLDHWELRAFWEAVDKRRDPPTESKALREALELERRRVDAILGSRLA